MKKRVIFRSGLRVTGMKCTKCMSKRDGIVIQNRCRWVIYATCGHLLHRGPVLPQEALEHMKLVNQKQSEDPRLRARMEFEAAEKRKKEMEKIAYEMGKLSRTRRDKYL